MNKMATVVGFFEETKTAKIQFDGEEQPAEKEYPYLSSYSPKLNDKVFCLAFGESFIILGEVTFQKKPFDLNSAIVENLKPIKDDLKDDLKAIEVDLGTVKGDLRDKYINKVDLEKELKENHTAGKGAHLIWSNVDNDSDGNRNINFIYVDPYDDSLRVRRVNGRWTRYKSV